VRTKLKNIKTGAVLERTFAAGETFEQPDFEEKTMQFLYVSENEFHFMDIKTYDQINLTEEQVGDFKWYLEAEKEYQILFFEGKPISIELPTSVILEVTTTEPGFKGDSVSNLTKNATLNTGLVVRVPLFIKEGNRVKVDTRTGEYLERA
jgi:elongation factor P